MLKLSHVLSDVHSYHEFCTFFRLNQVLKVPTRVTSRSSTTIYHILASYPERVSQSGVTNTGFSDNKRT